MSKKLSEIVDVLNKYRSTLHIPGFSVAIIENQHILYSQGFGVTEVEQPYQRVTPNTLFSIHGITESFTASALAHLETHAAFSLEQPVNHYLSDFKPDMTVAHLLSHTSGFQFPYSLTPLFDEKMYPFVKNMPEYKEMFQTIPDPDTLKENLYSREKVTDYYAGEKLTTTPGQEFNYFPDGYMIAAHVLEKVSGMSWEEYVKKFIFEPLDMKNTCIHMPSHVKDKSIATHYMSGMGAPYPVPTAWNEIAAPASSIYSTANDLSAYLMAQMNELSFLSKDSLHKMLMPRVAVTDKLHYGLGWRMTQVEGMRVVEQIGNYPGVSSAILFLPEKQFGLVFLANTDLVKLNKLGYRIIKKWFR